MDFKAPLIPLISLFPFPTPLSPFLHSLYLYLDTVLFFFHIVLADPACPLAVGEEKAILYVKEIKKNSGMEQKHRRRRTKMRMVIIGIVDKPIHCKCLLHEAAPDSFFVADVVPAVLYADSTWMKPRWRESLTEMFCCSKYCIVTELCGSKLPMALISF